MKRLILSASAVDTSRDRIQHTARTQYSADMQIRATTDKSLEDEKFSDTFKAADGQLYYIRFDGNIEVVISSIHPYDDTDYHWAKSLNAGKTFDIILGTKRILKDYKTKSYMYDDEEEFSTFTWQEIANVLEDMNKKAKLTARIIHGDSEYIIDTSDCYVVKVDGGRAKPKYFKELKDAERYAKSKVKSLKGRLADVLIIKDDVVVKVMK